MPQPALISTIGRRRFLTAVAAVMGGGVMTLVVGAEGARAAETVTLWRLNANWGYPVGPKNKTHCDCNACQVHAANKIYLTAAAALAGRIHVCCVCQPESFVVSASCAAALFASSSSLEMTDRRYPGVGVALASCFASPPPPSPGPSTGPIAAPTPEAAPTTPPSAAQRPRRPACRHTTPHRRRRCRRTPRRCGPHRWTGRSRRRATRPFP